MVLFITLVSIELLGSWIKFNTYIHQTIFEPSFKDLGGANQNDLLFELYQSPIRWSLSEQEK